MEPIKRCFISSEQANVLLFNHNLGKHEPNGIKESVLASLTIDTNAPLPQYYKWEWDKTNIKDLIIYDSFFFKSSMLLWDFDITLSNFCTILAKKNYSVSKFYYNSLTLRLYYIKTGQDIYHISNLYEFVHLLTNLSKKRKRL